ncbi:MAG: hypothetical protein KC496_03630 [Anaerolineae bacterium]|nr:hypothetical protein [Anaerolineae bacterium]
MAPRVKRGPKKAKGPTYDNPKRTSRVQTMNFYMGVPEDRIRRGTALDHLAHKLGVPNRSQLIQKIADGELTVIHT